MRKRPAGIVDALEMSVTRPTLRVVPAETGVAQASAHLTVVARAPMLVPEPRSDSRGLRSVLPGGEAMSTASRLAGEMSVPVRNMAQGRNRDRWFFTGMAAACALTVFVGFAPTYYLKGITGAPEISPLVHLHGILATAWMLLFLTQTALVATHRTGLHRRLGVLGAGLAVLLVVVGFMTGVTAARLGVTPPGGPPPLAFLSVPLGTITAFTILAGVGLYHRRRSEIHRRLMLLATIALLAPALARFRYFGPGGPAVAIGGTCAFVIACLVYDRSAHGRVHPAFLWGGLFLMVSLPLRFATGRTDAWLSIAGWLTR